MSRVDIARQMDQLAEAVSERPVPEWGSWVIYLIEKLDIEAKTKTRIGHSLEGEGWLASIRDEIDDRLKRGGW
jgi:DNA-binding MarR family transcriptional regulator